MGETMVQQIGKKHYLRILNIEEEKKLTALVDYLQKEGFHFYKLSERNEGSNRYVDVNISIKLS
jgi:hypothetical protein